jgi:hypothetical protein
MSIQAVFGGGALPAPEAYFDEYNNTALAVMGYEPYRGGQSINDSNVNSWGNDYNNIQPESNSSIFSNFNQYSETTAPQSSLDVAMEQALVALSLRGNHQLDQSLQYQEGRAYALSSDNSHSTDGMQSANSGTDSMNQDSLDGSQLAGLGRDIGIGVLGNLAYDALQAIIQGPPAVSSQLGITGPGPNSATDPSSIGAINGHDHQSDNFNGIPGPFGASEEPSESVATAETADDAQDEGDFGSFTGADNPGDISGDISGDFGGFGDFGGESGADGAPGGGDGDGSGDGDGDGDGGGW